VGDDSRPLGPPVGADTESATGRAADVAGPGASRAGVSDEALLHLVRDGDAEAFGRLYDRLAAAVFGTVRRVLHNPAQSEEVTQEVFLELWRTAARFDPELGTVRTWALTMAHRRAVDRVRSVQAAAHRDEVVARRNWERPLDDVHDTVARHLDAERLRRCLDALTPVQRESVTLAYYGGLTYTQVADRLATPVGTVKTRMRDGLIRLRDCLGVGHAR